MNRLQEIRRRAREERERFRGKSLLQDLCDWISKTHGIDVVAADGKSFLEGSRGELVLDEGCLYYDRTLEKTPEELLEVIAHEFGHLILHHEYFGDRSADLIRGSAFLETGSAALSRYSPRSQEEAEASAFAAEFICPARELFETWRTKPAITLEDLAEQYKATESVLQIQLAQGLYQFVNPELPNEAPTKEETATREQENAATALGKPVLVDAGPGTGKTKTLVHRVVHLITNKSVDPQGILVLTFSNEAATELRERIERAVGSDVASKILISTFHGFGVILLNVLGHHLGLPADFTIIDEARQEELLSDILAETLCEPLLNLKDPEETAANLVREINYLKDRMVGPAQLKLEIEQWAMTDEGQDALPRSNALLNIFEAYEREKSRIGAVDFADLIQLPHDLLLSRQDLRGRIRLEFPWVLVDEYQDVSRSTAQLLKQICGNDNPPWVVGDARQAIYRFRGAAPENVTDFGSDFNGAVEFHLSENYRSCPAVISTLNHMAEWLEHPDFSGIPRERWRPGRDVLPFGNAPGTLAIANSDLAEKVGVADTVEDWIVGGLKPDEIAVLARRNVDVRNIAIELKRRGIRAITTGILTAEGAGGDVAAVLTAVDYRTALPRVAYSLKRNRISAKGLNSAIGQVLSMPEETPDPVWTGSDQVRELASRLWKLSQELSQFRFSHDGWAVLCDFLFFRSEYLRTLVGEEQTAESSVQLEELLSALAFAASYRFGHSHNQPRRSRLGLAERMREILTQSAPGLVPPRAVSGAVRVMTCHASKGLQFPAVIVAGQSLSEIAGVRPLLPPKLRPDPNLHSAQADSLLFVGISRAERVFLACFASSASGRPRGRLRRVPNLLQNLQTSGVLPISRWQLSPVQLEALSVARVWGGETPEEFSTFSLDSKTCGVRTYLEEQLGARFGGRIRPLYPEFIKRVRNALRSIIASAIETGRPLADSDADRIAEREWPANEKRDHPHYGLYRPRLFRWARALAEEFDPIKHLGASVRQEPFCWKDERGCSRLVKLQLIAEIHEAGGDVVAIALQVNTPGDLDGDIRWSELDDYERLPFVLLHEREGEVDSKIFVGEQGQIRSFLWSSRKPMETNQKLAISARETFNRLVSGEFNAHVSDWGCDRCRCRTICPAWIGAITIDDSDAAS